MASGRDALPGSSPDDRLTLHLRTWLGAWPPSSGLEVVGSAAREAPAWDGTRHRLVGVVRADAGVVSVPPRARERVARRTSGMPDVDDPRWRRAVADLLDAPELVVGIGVFRAVTTDAEVATHPDVGRWVDATDGRVPAWLRPFNAPQVLLATDDRGAIVGGVGIKLHDRYGAELAVVTDRQARGRGLGRSLVAQAARRVLAGGRAVTYLHGPDNVASARLADAVGFRDRGWRVLGLFPRAG
jgi:GNAT superfamily N-acetyltransferase